MTYRFVMPSEVRCNKVWLYEQLVWWPAWIAGAHTNGSETQVVAENRDCRRDAISVLLLCVFDGPQYVKAVVGAKKYWVLDQTAGLNCAKLASGRTQSHITSRRCAINFQSCLVEKLKQMPKATPKC